MLSYEEFLQTPASFMYDMQQVISLKKKWGLELTTDESAIASYMVRARIRSLQGLLNSKP